MSSGSTNFYSATSKSATSNGGTTSGTTSGSGSSSTIRTSRRMVLPKPGGSGTSTSSTSTTATRRTTGAASRPRQTYRASSARGTGTTATTSSLPLPSATGAATAATTTTATSSSSPTRSAAAKHKTSMATATATARARGTTTTTTAARSTHLASRTAPSRPVGSYYASSTAPVPAATPTHASSLSSSSSSAPAPIADAGGEESADHDTWEDWGSPAPKAAPHASAAAGAGATTNEWYSAPATYTSSGFGTQPAQQQQQQQQQPMQPGNGFYQSSQTQQEQQPFLSGAMDSSAPNLIHTAPAAAANPASGSTPSFSMFLPSAPMQDAAGADTSMGGMADAYDNNFDPSFEGDEAPLLEELGINVQHILLKTKTVVVPFSRFGGDQIDPKVVCQEADLPGPVALLLLLGGEMVLTGKLQFGFIYVYGLLGCMAMTLVTNLISPTEAVSFWTVTSIMGYSLLPVNILALIKIFVMDLINLQKLGNFLGALTVLWSTLASTRLLEMGCGLRDQRYLIMYPLLLFYSAFVMMTIF